MFLGIFIGGAILAALAWSYSLGGFSGLGWLWQLPVGFVVSFLALVIVSFLIFFIRVMFLDPDKPREKDSRVFRWVVMQWVHVVLTVIPVRIRVVGKEKLPKDGRFLLVSNHLANIDPAVFFYAFPRVQLAFVGKKETRNMFLVNKVMPKLLCPNINRENDREALKTILRCVQLLKEDTVNVGIFPEGKINSYRKFAHLKPGVFKIAQKANVPVVVCTLRGTNHVIPRMLKLKTSKAEVHLVDVIPAEALQGRNTVDIARQVYEMMAKDLGPELVLTPEEEEKA